MRELLYHAYLRYPRAFYDRHATGQVLSRATNDLYPIRYFIGWGLVQGMQSVMMIIAAGIVLVLVDPQLDPLHSRVAAADRVTSPTASGTGSRRSRARCRRGRETSPRRPTRRSSGSRWCRPSAARTTCASRFGERAEGVRYTVLRPGQASRRSMCPASTTCPRSRSPPSCSSAAAQVIARRHHDRRVRPLRDAAPPARLAARGDRLDPRTWRSGHSLRPAAASAGSRGSSRCPSRRARATCRRDRSACASSA